MTDERILFEQVRHCLGAQGKLPLLPPLWAALGMVILAIALKSAHFQLLYVLCYVPINLNGQMGGIIGA